IIGVYPEDVRSFPIGTAMNKNLTIRMGNCPHRRYIPHLIDLTVSGQIDPARILTQEQPLQDAVKAFEAFDRREAGWLKVMLDPAEVEITLQELQDKSTHREDELDEAIDESFPASDPS